MLFQTILLVALLIVAIAILIALITKRESQVMDFQEFITTSIRTLFDKETQELAKAYAEQRQLVRYIEEMAESSQLDVTKLADDAEKHAYALAVKKANDAVLVAESSLAQVKLEIGEVQKTILKDADYSNMVSTDKNKLKLLLEQEQHATKRVARERRHLAVLVGTRPVQKEDGATLNGTLDN